MAIKRSKLVEIVNKLRQADFFVGQRKARIDAIRSIGVTEETYYPWRKLYGDMGMDALKELKRLQKENEHLCRAISGLSLEKLILRAEIEPWPKAA